MVDWSKPMIPQIGKLGNQYSDWVHKPVDRPLRLFYYDFLEILTKTPWWLVPVYWIPVIIYLIYDGIKEYDNVSAYKSLSFYDYYPPYISF